jgi:hypothetical protein
LPDPQLYIDRLLEAENLTGDLIDEDATWLLDWGVQQLKGMAAETSDPEALGQKSGALMKFMRGLNRIGGGLPHLDPAGLPPLAESYALAFGSSRTADEAACAQAAAQLTSLPPRQAMEFLIEWVKGPV